MKRKVIVTPDLESEKFTKSNCDCKFCIDMNNANQEWQELRPTTNLQNRMKNVISAIETRERTRSLSFDNKK
jgi:hypothetical protein